MTHTLNCEINTRVGGDHAYCECSCHCGRPAIPPSRERRNAEDRFITAHLIEGRDIATGKRVKDKP